MGPVPEGLDLTGWQFFGPDEDLDFEEPDPELMDTSRCPCAEHCEACGGTEHLRPVITAFSRHPGGFDVGCATLCHHCDGQSFLHLLGPAGLDTAFTRHAEHAAAQ